MKKIYLLLSLFLTLTVSGQILPGVVASQRVIVSGALQDDDADAYLTAEGITDATAVAAITQFVLDLKDINNHSAGFVNFDNVAAGNRRAIYPFPGTVATYNTLNLLNPVAQDTAFQLSITGTPLIDADGVKFETNELADTHFNPSTQLVLDSVEIDFVHSENLVNTSLHVTVGASNAFWLGSETQTSFQLYYGIGNISSQLLTNVRGVTNAFYQLNKTSNTAGDLNLYKNNKLWYTSTGAAGGTLPNATVKINNAYSWTNRRFSYVAMGEGISANANALYKKAIERYNYTMGRLRVNNVFFEGHSFIVYPSSTARPGAQIIDSLLINNTLALYDNSSVASGGETVSTLTSRIATVNAYLKDNANVPFENIMVLWVGTNDIVSSGQGTSVYNALETYVETQLANGWDRIIVYTCTPSAAKNATFETERVIFNGLITGTLDAIAGVDVIDTDNIAVLTDSTNGTYFNADQLHLVAAGVAAAVSPLRILLESLYTDN